MVPWSSQSSIGDFGDSKGVINVAEILLYNRVFDRARNKRRRVLGEKFALCGSSVFGVNGAFIIGADREDCCATSGATIRYTTDGADPSRDKRDDHREWWFYSHQF